MNLSTRNINLGKEGVWEGNCSCNTFLILKLLSNYIHSTKPHICFTSRLPLTPVVMSSVRPQSVRTTVIIGHPAYRFSDPRPHISRKISRFYLQTDWRVINLFLLSFISYRFLCKTEMYTTSRLLLMQNSSALRASPPMCAALSLSVFSASTQAGVTVLPIAQQH